MLKMNAHLMKLLQRICHPDNEDLARSNWLFAAEMLAGLPPAARQDALTTPPGKEIQQTVYRLWMDTPSIRRATEDVLLALSDERLIRSIPFSRDGIALLGKIGAPTAVERLLNLLASQPSREITSYAIQALGETASPAAVKAITPLLDGPYRHNALLALGRANTPESAAVLLDWLKRDGSGPVSEAFEKLSNPNIEETLLKAIDIHTRPCVVKALGRVGGSAAFNALTRLIKKAVQQPGRNAFLSAAFEALARIPLPDTVSALEEFVYDKTIHFGIRSDAIETLAKFSHPAARGALIRLVCRKSLEPELRRVAADAFPAPLSDTETQRLLDAYAGDSSDMADNLAIILRKSLAEEALPVLRNLLTHPRELAQNEAAISLGLRGDLQAEDALISLLQTRYAAGQPAVSAIYALGKLQSNGALPLLGRFLRDEKYLKVWRYVAEAVRRIGSSAATPDLLQAAKTIKAKQLYNNEAWKSIAGALAVVGGEAGAACLLDIFESTPHWDGWMTAFRMIKRPAALPPLLAGAQSEKAAVREICMKGLSGIASPQIIPPLVAGLQDPDEEARLSAEKGLSESEAQINDPATIQIVLNAVENPDIKQTWALFDCLKRARGDALTRVCQQTTDWLQKSTFRDVDTNIYAIRLLGDLYCETGVAVLGELLLNAPDASCRSEAAWALGKIGTDNIVPCLLEALQSERDARTLANIHLALGQVQFLCDLIDHLPLTKDILITLSRQSDIRIFTDGRVVLSSGPPTPCREAFQNQYTRHYSRQ